MDEHRGPNGGGWQAAAACGGADLGRGKTGRRASDPSGAAERRLLSETRRLLAHLCATEDGAYAVADPFDHRRLRLVRRRRGAGQAEASLSAEAGERLVAADLARWQAAPSGRRLLATETALSRLARDSAPAGVDPFLAQHQPLEAVEVETDGGTATTLRDAAESPLAWLASRREANPLFDDAGLAAGERLRRDLTLAAMLPRVAANWSAAAADARRGGGPEAGSATVAMVAARQRARRALDAVGSDFAGILVDVCGFAKSFGVIESERRWPRRSAKVVLALALNRLARHYGLAAAARGPDRSAGILAWGTADSRPEMG